MEDYSSLYSGADASQANIYSAIIDSAATITSNIMSVKAKKLEMQAAIDEIKAKQQQALTDAMVRKYQEEIAYYEYIESILDDLQHKLEKMQRKQQRKRVIVYGGCALIMLAVIGISFNQKR